MPDLNWGMLAKSQVDPETIEEAIARIIAEHNADEESHLAAGQSLQSHKAAEIIDHLAKSVYRDKLIFDRFQVDEHFNTIDIWNKNVNVEQTGYGGMTLRSPNEAGLAGEAFIYPTEGMASQATKIYSPSWESRLKFSSNSDQIVYFGMYDVNEPMGAGFKILNGTLYACYGDLASAEQLVEIAGITLTVPHTYRIEMLSSGNTTFYVDGILKATVATSLISDSGLIAYYFIDSTTTTPKIMDVMSLHFDADYQSD